MAVCEPLPLARNAETTSASSRIFTPSLANASLGWPRPFLNWASMPSGLSGLFKMHLPMSRTRHKSGPAALTVKVRTFLALCAQVLLLDTDCHVGIDQGAMPE